MNPRYRPIAYAVGGLLAVWLIAGVGFFVAHHSKMTAEKLKAFVEEIDLSKLSGEARAKAIRDLIAKLNSLSLEERRKARADHLWAKLFDQMTDEEKAKFIEETLPTGFKQMLEAFEKLPQEKRQKVVDNAVKRMRENNEMSGGGNPYRGNKDGKPRMNEDLQKKAVEAGLKTFFTQSSAQTKAEMAPLMEEIQHSMETGRMFR
jgi:hypothetical protein